MVIENGYANIIGRVDLSKEKAIGQKIGADFSKKLLGGSGFAAKFLYEELESDVNPLSPKNILFFGIGPFQGTSILSSGRWTVCTKSPLTGFWADSSCGGHAPWYLKTAGFDSLVFQGRSKNPVYAYVHDGEVELRDAGSIWGKDSHEANQAVKDDLGKEDVYVSTIGPAGENLVRFACVVNDNHGYCGRGGLGAVMGSKNLKAIAIEETEDVTPADPEKLQKVKKDWLGDLKESKGVEGNREHGQIRAVELRSETGVLPMKNWKQDEWEEAHKISAPDVTEKFELKPWPCENCMMGCHRRITGGGLPEWVQELPGPEYETASLLGANLLIDDPEELFKANALCNRYGIDTMEMGGIMGLVCECYEEGMLSEEELPAKPKWGSGEALMKFIEATKDRDGFGSVIAEGIKATAQHIGGDAQRRAIHVKGQSAPAHDPRAHYSMGVAFATSLRGACHLRGFPKLVTLGVPLPEADFDEMPDRHDWKRKGELAAVKQDEMNIYNSLVSCWFYRAEGGLKLSQFADALNAITGWNFDGKKLLKVGERITNIQRSFNLKMGQDPIGDDSLPIRLETPHDVGGSAGKTPPMKKMLEEYYDYKDWPGGVPSEQKLKELNLSDSIDLKELGYR